MNHLSITNISQLKTQFFTKMINIVYGIRKSQINTTTFIDCSKKTINFVRINKRNTYLKHIY